MKNKKVILVITVLLLLCCISCCLCSFFFSAVTPFVQVEGNSMEPNFQNGEIYFMNRIIDINRGDVIVFHKNGIDYVKRVVGLPGEIFEMKNGEVFINGIELDEPYLEESQTTVGMNFLTEGVQYTIPVNNYLVLGDNRENSLDSRSFLIGYIESSVVEGEIAFKIIPFENN